jgi:TetR/AcrR family transcriptional regulator, transcriptional repressor for nem operon
VPVLTEKGAATRQRIVVAAAALMYEQGVAATSTQAVQEAAGVSASQLYHYFADKRALVRAVVAYQSADVIERHRSLLAELDSFEALEGWRDAVIGFQWRRNCEGGCPLGSLASELADADPELRGDLADAFGAWEQALSSGLASMRARGELRADADTNRLALALLAALQGGLLLTQTRRDTIALETVLDTMIERIRMDEAQPHARRQKGVGVVTGSGRPRNSSSGHHHRQVASPVAEKP